VIDFRYYVVSTVSIFLALAVGIVLGAGPLKGDIGTRLTEQMTALRAEKTQLRTDLDLARRNATARDTFSLAVAPSVMKDRLAGKTVAVVVAPGVDADLVKNTTTSLVAAGAKVGSTVTLTDAWADPAKATLRNTVASPFASSRYRCLPAVRTSSPPPCWRARSWLAPTSPPSASPPRQWQR
jgi:hypothetical protein